MGGNQDENDNALKVLKSIRKIDENDLDSNVEEKKEGVLNEDNLSNLNQVEVENKEKDNVEEKEIIKEEVKQEVLEKEILKEEVKEEPLEEEITEKEIIKEEIKPEVKEEERENIKKCAKCHKDYEISELIKNSDNYAFSKNCSEELMNL